jgi:uncharacterized protein
MQAVRAILGGLFFLVLATVGLAELKLPELTGPVVDNAGILSANSRQSIEARLRDYQSRSGHQVVVATVPSSQGLDIRDYGNRLFRYWALGDKNRNDGVLVLVAPSERNVSIEVGYGLEGDLTDALSRVIIDHAMLPRFKLGDYAGGLLAGIDDIEKALGGGGAEIVERVRNEQSPDSAEFWIIIILFVVVLILVSRVSRGGGIIVLPGPGRTYDGYGGGWSQGGSPGGGYSGGGGSSGGGGASGRW